MSRKILLRSNDNEYFEVDVAVALKSQTLRHMIEDGCSDGCITLYNVNGRTMAKVIDYCKEHVDENADHKSWDSIFVDVEQDILFDVILAANYLDIKGLLDLTCQRVADMITDTTLENPEQLKKIFNIKTDFRPEEEEEFFARTIEHLNEETVATFRPKVFEDDGLNGDGGLDEEMDLR